MEKEFEVTEERIARVNIVERIGNMNVANKETIMTKEAFREAFKKYIVDDLDVRIKLLYPDSMMPVYGTDDSIAVDLYSHERALIGVGEIVLVGTGIALASDSPASALAFPRSGLSSKKGLTLANCTGLLDNDYRGEIKIALHNIGYQDQLVEKGERIAQLAFFPRYLPKFRIVEELDETERGDGGFGHTGTTDITQ